MLRGPLPALVLGLALLAPLQPASGAGDTDRVFVNRVADHEQFQLFSVPINGTPFTKFVIDAKTEQPYYFWTAVYPFHYHFVNEVLLRGRGAYASIHDFNRRNHEGEERDYLLGSIAYHPAQKIYTFEFLEADRPTAGIIRRTHRVLKGSFFDPGILWRPVGKQDSLRAHLDDVPTIEAGMLEVGGNYQFLNAGKAVGRLNVVRPGTDIAEANLGRDEIVLLYEIPMDISPVAGVIALRFSTPLSHVNLRARAWGIPNIGLKDGLVRTRGLERKWVYLQARRDGFELRAALGKEVRAAKRARQTASRDVRVPAADRAARGLPALSELTAADGRRVGAKAANLGELIRGKTANYEVPPGFAIPFGHYTDFLKHNGLGKQVDKLLKSRKLRKDRAARRQALEDLRAAIRAGQHLPAFRKALLARAQQPPYGGHGFFVRSSTNAEDLEGFNGAGLYDTVPNVRGDEPLLAAVKQVWASLWNVRAYEERDFYRIDHSACFPGVIVQVGVNASAAGVLITHNLYEPSDAESVTINAKHGLGLRVVDGRRVPEQVLYNRRTTTMRIISRSDDPVALVFDEAGGVREVRTENKPVLTEDFVRKLAAAATDVEHIFAGKGPQDIEWLVVDGGVQVVQSRPYVQPETVTR